MFFQESWREKLTVLVDTDVLSSEKILAVLKGCGEGELHGVLAVGRPATGAGGASSRARFPTTLVSTCVPPVESHRPDIDITYTLNQSPDPS